MKSNTLLVLACLISMPVLAQGLPDEINYAPYESRFLVLVKETDAAQATLNQSRSSLAEAQRFIREMTSHLSNLENQITSDEAEISRLRFEIPQLEREISRLRSEDSQVMSQLRSKQNEESNLISRYQEAQRDLRPLEEILARKEARLRELQSELNQYERAERDAENRLSRAQTEAQRLERSIAEARDQVRMLQDEYRSIESRINSTISEASQAESSLGTLRSELSQEEGKLNALNGRVAEYESEVGRLRSSGAPAEEIAQAERKLNAARNTRDNTAAEISNLQGQIARTELQVRTLRSRIDDLRRTQAGFPSRISQTENRERQLQSERAQAQNELNRYSAELQMARRNVEIRQQQVAQARAEIRGDEQNVMRQRQFIENISRQIEVVRSEIAQLTQRSRNLNAEIARLSEVARSHTAAIPRLEQEIRNAESEIAEGQRDLNRARNDERTFTTAVSRDEQKLSEVTSRRNLARGEMDQRRSLYNRYLDEAEALGTAQTGSAISLGEKEGDKIARTLSKQNGVAVGSELGTAEAKYWAAIRGEVIGFDSGYAQGMASSEDIGRAKAEAQVKAASDAELFAQTNFKPVFFEEFVQEEFKKPLILKTFSQLTKSKFKSLHFQLERSFESIPSLTQAEIDLSLKVVTPLDQQISESEKSVKVIEQKARRLSQPDVTFEAPTSIPYGQANCTQVYKNLAVFKAACEGSYRGSFANNYVNAARTVYGDIYTQLFQSEFNHSNVSIREAKYAGELALSTKVGAAEGLRVGKIEIYQRTFESTYKTTYTLELEKARAKAKSDAAGELAAFLQSKPLLTTQKTDLVAEDFRGGEEVLIEGAVKNVGAVDFNGPVLFRIVEAQNAAVVQGEAVLNNVGARGVTVLPALKIKVAGSAKAGEKIMVKGILEFPGDLYRASRQERFELVKTLSANPSHELKADYNKTPEIKGVFRRYIHFSSVTITPKVEDIAEGYKLTLTPVADAANHIEMKESLFETGALKAGSAKEVRFSYVFKDSAKGKSLNMELAVSYLGKVIKKELLTVVPK